MKDPLTLLPALLLVPLITLADLKEDFSDPVRFAEEWVPYGRLADGTWAQGLGKARPEWWTLEEGALCGQSFPDEQHPAGISRKENLPQAKLAETGARISWRIKVTATSRGTLRLFGISSGPHSQEATDNHLLALEVSAVGIRLLNGNRELTAPAADKESRKYRNTVFEEKSRDSVTPGTWHTLTMEVKGRDVRVFLDGKDSVKMKLPQDQPLRSLSLEADGDKKSPGLAWFDDIAVAPLEKLDRF
jgi:hypothetical protein